MPSSRIMGKCRAKRPSSLGSAPVSGVSPIRKGEYPMPRKKTGLFGCCKSLRMLPRTTKRLGSGVCGVIVAVLPAARAEDANIGWSAQAVKKLLKRQKKIKRCIGINSGEKGYFISISKPNRCRFGQMLTGRTFMCVCEHLSYPLDSFFDLVKQLYAGRNWHYNGKSPPKIPCSRCRR